MEISKFEFDNSVMVSLSGNYVVDEDNPVIDGWADGTNWNQVMSDK